VTVVSDGVRLRADLPRAGDEPLMLARALPGVSVLVCPDRFLAGRLAERHLGATVHLLDDGFQHVQLERDVDLLILDRADLASGETLPTGRLREPLETARYADALLLAGMEAARGDGLGDAAAHLGVAETFALTRQFEPVVEEAAGGPRPVAPATRVVAVCGIARPDFFFAGLDGTGLVVADRVSFRDHHAYATADVARLAATLRAAGADTILTTEKDLVRLLPLRPWPFRVAVRPMSVRVEPPGAFAAWLLDRLGACRARRREAA
jgi:tetraacyldisaccharide 4'-kinase